MITYTICRETQKTLKRECYEHPDDVGIKEAAPVLARLIVDYLENPQAIGRQKIKNSAKKGDS